MKEILRAFSLALKALRHLVDLTGILLISSLFVLFGLQFKHPAAWDNMGLLMRFRRAADPLLAQIASGLDLTWPAEKPSLIPLVLSVTVFFFRSFLVHVLEGGSAAIRRRIAKAPKARKRGVEAPPAASPVGLEPEVIAGAAPHDAATPAPVAPIAQAAPPVAEVLPSAPAPLPASEATRVASRPAPEPARALATPMPTPPPAPIDGTSLSDFLHMGSETSEAPTMVGRTPRPETPAPARARRRAVPAGVDSEAATMAGGAGRSMSSSGALPVYGRYELLEELGRGGMGVVYKARDPKIDRVVAIKSILATHSDDESAEEYERRFRREVKAVGKLTHPSIVTVYDFIEDHLGRPAMVMEFVEGETLQQFATRKRPTLSRSLEIMIQAAEALDHAHAQGIVHRDMKPANILIGRDGRAKVSDFGIAKVGGGTNTNTKGSLVGTPAFMSPEQFLGRKVDGRSDIFSLGGILYWLCTGERPFVGDTVANLAYQIVHVNPPSVLRFNPNLPALIDEIIAASMAKSEDGRYPSARAFAEDLKALRDGRPLPSLALVEPAEQTAIVAEELDAVEVVEVLDESELPR